MNTPISVLLERKGSDIRTVSPDVTVIAAVVEMNRHRIGSIVVCENKQPVGIFTERDVLRRIVGEGRDPRTTIIRDVMTSGLITITPATTVEQTMVIFAEKRCRHLPVLAAGELVGLISIGDISRWISDSDRAEAEQLKNYIAGGYGT